jgi:membrane-bound serine protease (ClpP class)
MRTMRKFAILSLVSAFLGILLSFGQVMASAARPEAVVLTLDGPVSSIWIDYIQRGFDLAESSQADVIVIQLNTPGGSIDLMNRIVQTIRSSPVPVVVYVSPRNAMAASAGTIITLAGHVDAMAPETTIGAASPVGSQGEDIGTTMESKVKEILKASVRGLTKNRSAEATKLAEDTIDNARAVTVEEALAAGLVDIKANDINDLLKQLNGRSISFNDQTVVFNLGNVLVTPVNPTMIEQFLTVLVNSNIVFILLSVGVWAILIELSSPGGWVAGFFGAVCLLLAVYGMGLLPVNWFGLLFLVLAFVLFIIDIKAPTHGALTAAGAGSFIAGSLVLFNSIRVPGVPGVSVPLVVGTGIFIAATFFVIVTFAIRAQRTPVQTGKEAILGQRGFTRSALVPKGTAQVAGELWQVKAEPETESIAAGVMVEVVGVDGLLLIVRKVI